ncbi:hypothetical protein BOTNAR_0468g00050 [Botryotinia narcissicola]|uniref:Uncharacterized protein n=1 Tax=Botryotinia narcissicola TaxID=278944 RepID=A0A4Z1HIZ8_9HELO|nr:hypothetical protein BOTNAR_0468g00050 [Botryotinia narcissicola]
MDKMLVPIDAILNPLSVPGLCCASISRIFHVWHVRYTPFEDLNTDKIMLSSPSRNMLWTADPELIDQISSQAARSVKPVELFGFFGIYGPNMQTTINDDGKLHRKMIAPPIGSHSNIKMWQASLFETKKFTDLLIQKISKVTLMKDCLFELTLHCVIQSLFDPELTFEYFKEGSTSSKQVERTGFVEAMFTTIDKMEVVDNISSRIRGKSP